MRRLLLLILFPALLCAQGVRYSATVTQQGTIGTATNAVILPAGPVVAFCNHPANAVPCTNKATTYTDQTLATPCNTSTQIVRDGTTTCVTLPDAQNNWGVWVPPNTAGYDYTITVAGVSTGPFNVLSQTTTHGVTETFTGLVYSCQPNGELYVGTGITCWAGADIGAQINTAYAALPALGGVIHVIPGTYTYTTPILLTTGATKNVKLLCPLEETTVLNYTPSTGVAITIDGGNGNNGGIGIENCTVTGAGSGNSTTGIQLGATVGLSGAMFKNNSVRGFGKCFGNPNGGIAYLTNFTNNHVTACNVGMELAGEGNQIFGGLVGHNVTGITMAQSGDTSLHQVSIDDNSTVGISVTNQNALFFLYAGHFENAGLGTDFYINQTAGYIGLFGGFILSDLQSGSSTQFITASGGHLDVEGTGFCTPLGHIITEIANLSGTVNAILRPRLLATSVCTVASIQSIFNSSYTGGYVLSEAESQGVNTQSPQIKASVPQYPTLCGTEGSARCYYLRENGGNLEFFDATAGAVRASIQSPGGGNAFFQTNIGHSWIETTPSGGISNQEVSQGDSTFHGLIWNLNNGGYQASSIKTTSLTADWTCGTGGTVSSCTSATIIGSGGGVPWTFNLPLVAGFYTLECDGVVGQATAVTANQWNLLTATNGATNVTANYDMYTAATAKAGGAITDQASTTTTFQIAPSWTLGAITTKMPFHIWAKIEGASASGTVLSVQLVAPTVGDLVTIYRGSGCRLF